MINDGASEYKRSVAGTPFEEYKKQHPNCTPNKTTKTVRIVKPGEKIPFSPGVPGRGNAR
jgi:hypothetical protein